MPDTLQLTGRAGDHVHRSEDPRFALHRDMLEPFLAMRAAAGEGIDPATLSGFRDFESQARI